MTRLWSNTLAGLTAVGLLFVAGCGPRSEREVRYRVEPGTNGSGVDAGPAVDDPDAPDGGPAGPQDEVDADGGPTDPSWTDAGPTSPTGPDGPPDATTPSVRILSPTEGEDVANPVTFLFEGAGVDSLRLSADGWLIATWRPAEEGWSRQYRFQNTDRPRAVLVEGLDLGGDVLVSDELTIRVSNGEAQDDWGVQFADNLMAHAAEYLDEAWSHITAGTPCVAFFSVGLRRHPDPARRFPDFYATVTEGPPSEACELQGRCSLEVRGFSGPHTDASRLQKGDICFTSDVAPFAGELWPDHSYVFVAWETPGQTDYAWVIDNRQEFGAPYVRNITAPSSSESPFTPFQYFMRSPFQAAP